MKSATGASLLIGAVLGGLIVVVSLLFTGDTRFAFVVLGVGLPTLLLQDSWRFVFFAAGLPRRASINDAIWTVAQFALIFTVTASGRPRMPIILAAWCAAGVIAAVAGVLQARALPSLRRGFAWVSSTRDLSSRFVTEFTIGNGTSQILFWLVSLTAGILAAAALRAAQLLLGLPGWLCRRRTPPSFPRGYAFAGAGREIFHRGADSRDRAGWWHRFVGGPVHGPPMVCRTRLVGRELEGSEATNSPADGDCRGVRRSNCSDCSPAGACGREPQFAGEGADVPNQPCGDGPGRGVDGARGAAMGTAAGALFAASVTWFQWRAELAHQPPPAHAATRHR